MPKDLIIINHIKAQEDLLNILSKEIDINKMKHNIISHANKHNLNYIKLTVYLPNVPSKVSVIAYVRENEWNWNIKGKWIYLFYAIFKLKKKNTNTEEDIYKIINRYICCEKCLIDKCE